MKNHRNQLVALAVAVLLMASGPAMAQESDRSDQERSKQGSTQDTMQGSWGRSSDQDTIQGRSSGTLEPDNSGVNKRDRKEGEVTADEQGQSDADMKMTRNIRRAIIDDESLSTYGRNIKIITKDGMVTLKGPVRSYQEKLAIEAKAAALAGEGKVKNQIEVKASKDDRKESESEKKDSEKSEPEKY